MHSFICSFAQELFPEPSSGVPAVGQGTRRVPPQEATVQREADKISRQMILSDKSVTARRTGLEEGKGRTPKLVREDSWGKVGLGGLGWRGAFRQREELGAQHRPWYSVGTP